MTILALCLCTVLCAQRKGISLQYEPLNKGAGLRFDLEAGKHGGYLVAATGNYHMYGQKVINRHVKITAGFVWYLKTYDRTWQNTLFAGISGHRYTGVTRVLPPLALSMLSAEAGMECLYRRKYKFGAAYDPLKGEVAVHVGLMF